MTDRPHWVTDPLDDGQPPSPPHQYRLDSAFLSRPITDQAGRPIGSTTTSPTSPAERPLTSLALFSSTPGLADRFTYHPPPDIDVAQRHAAARSLVLDVATALDNLVPPGRERATMLTKLEEALFWANAGVARHNWSEQ